MSYASVIDKAIEENQEAKAEGFTESDEAYIRFRRVVESGMVNAGFDLIPSKSSDVTQRSSGERFTDQTLRGHILNGAAFGAQFNHTLKKIDPHSSLAHDELLNALAVFACHDFHKTDESQKRRLRSEDGLGDEDKDLGEDEVRKLVDTLRLEELDTDLCFRDYYASALGAEKMSGRHKQVSSKRFDILKDWVRLMDAAAGMQSPVEAKSLENRVQKISSEVSLHYHSVNDTRGVSTNILNHAISEYLTDNDGVEDIVYFHNGVIYVSKADLELSRADGNIRNERLGEILDKFIEEIHDSKEKFEIPVNLSPKGYYKIESMSYFLSGVDNSLEIARNETVRKGNSDSWDPYSVYDDGVIAALAWDILKDVPTSHHKPQTLGIYAGTLFMELFQPLNNDNVSESISDLCESLELDHIIEPLLTEYSTEEQSFSLSDLSGVDLEAIAENTGMSKSEIKNDIDSTDLHGSGGGSKGFAQLIGLAFLEEDSTSGVPRKQLPIDDLLSEMKNMAISYYHDWNKRWDEHRNSEWDTEWSAEQKIDKFELELQGVLPKASRHYIRENLEIDGKWFTQKEENSKFKEYTSKYQPNVCLLCNDVLVGGTQSSGIFDASENLVGRSLTFSHMKEIDAGGGEPNAVICPVCNIEMVLRNSVHDTFTNHDENEDPSQYLVVAPDYFYSPVDITIEKILKRELYEGGGNNLLQISRELIGSDPSKRSEAIESILSTLKKAEEREEFQNNLKNYDAEFNVKSTLGVYRLDPPRRQNSQNQNDLVTRVPRWYLTSYFAVVFSWLTSSRVLLTDTPIPTTEFDDFNEMIQIEGAPAPIQRFVGETVTISRLGERGVWTEYEFAHLMKSDGGEPGETDTTSGGGVEYGQTTLTQHHANKQSEETQDETTTYELRINTGLAESLYKLSAFMYVGSRTRLVQRRNGSTEYRLQRLSSLISDLQEPFVGANTLLKGNEQVGDYTALRAADILDTLIHQDMNNRLEELAEVGFEAAQPNPDTDSNHEYERLFRVARDSISDGVTKNADRDEMINMVAGDVMKAAARARKKNARTGEDEKYAKEKYTREPAEEFARIFIDDVFIGMCDGEFYELRRFENKLASGYNAAIRRKLQEWFDKHSD